MDALASKKYPFPVTGTALTWSCPYRSRTLDAPELKTTAVGAPDSALLPVQSTVNDGSVAEMDEVRPLPEIVTRANLPTLENFAEIFLLNPSPRTVPLDRKTLNVPFGKVLSIPIVAVVNR